jgi:hypothetical protein
VLELSDLPKTLTWEKISQNFKLNDQWVGRIWEKMVLAGYANYRNESERNNVFLRLIALTDFYYVFLADFLRERWGFAPLETGATNEIPIDFLYIFLKNYVTRLDQKFNQAPTLEMALDDIKSYYVFPKNVESFEDIEGIAVSLYIATYPTVNNDPSGEFFKYHEDLDSEEIAKTEAFQDILEWLKEKFATSVQS